ncbi:MAG: hypothetical protein PHU21_10470 [Elusimicrobia bacterium]|nr:hypothetical protein [Elusimicrobiota bacterium]
MKAMLYRSLAVILSGAALWFTGVSSMQAAQSEKQFPDNQNPAQEEPKKGGCCGG